MKSIGDIFEVTVGLKKRSRNQHTVFSIMSGLKMTNKAHNSVHDVQTNGGYSLNSFSRSEYRSMPIRILVFVAVT